MEIPETRYTSVGDSQIAYQVFGEGPDLLYSTGFFLSHVDHLWQLPEWARFLRRLSSFCRVTIFDRRGTGASDPLPPTGVSFWENWVDDLTAVLETIGVERTAIMANTDAGVMAMLFAAAFPQRVSALILSSTAARSRPAEDYALGIPPEAIESYANELEAAWGKEDGFFADVIWPSRARDPDFRKWMARLQRAVMTPHRAAELWRLEMGLDVRRALPLIQAPTLLAATDFALVPRANLEYLAERIGGSKLIDLEGDGAIGYMARPDEFLRAIEEHITGEVRSIEPNRVLATVLFTDIVGSTERVAELGDARWKELLLAHHDVVRAELQRFGGKEIDTAGDGFLATFDGPARAVRCALSIVERVRTLGIEIRAGAHTGECELVDQGIGGIAVHIGARVAAAAAASEVLVSSTVKDLVGGSGLHFEDRGLQRLKGVPETWHLYRAGA